MKYCSLFFCVLILASSCFAKTLSIALPSNSLTPSSSNISAYKNFITALEKASGWHFDVTTFAGFKQLKTIISSQKATVILTPLYLYLDAKRCNLPYQQVATTLIWNMKEKKNTPYYSVFIISRKDDSSINNLYNLKNTNFGFVGHIFSGEHIYTIDFFKQHHIASRKFFNSYQSLDSINELFNAIESKVISAGAVCTRSLNPERLHEFKVLATISKIPNPVFIASTQLGKEDIDILQHALLSLPPSAFKQLLFSGLAKTNAGTPSNLAVFPNKQFCQKERKQHHAYRKQSHL